MGIHKTERIIASAAGLTLAVCLCPVASSSALAAGEPAGLDPDVLGEAYALLATDESTYHITKNPENVTGIVENQAGAATFSTDSDDAGATYQWQYSVSSAITGFKSLPSQFSSTGKEVSIDFSSPYSSYWIRCLVTFSDGSRAATTAARIEFITFDQDGLRYSLVAVGEEDGMQKTVARLGLNTKTQANALVDADECPEKLTVASEVTYKGKSYQVGQIGKYAFSGCDDLETVTIPSEVTSIGAYAFANCHNLRSVEFAEDSSLTSMGESAFAVTSANESGEITGALEAFAIPEGVTKFEAYLFYNQAHLVTIDMGPKSLTTVETGCLAGCTSLERFDFPEVTEYVERGAFYNASWINMPVPENPSLKIVTFAGDLPESLINRAYFPYTICPYGEQVVYYGHIWRTGDETDTGLSGADNATVYVTVRFYDTKADAEAGVNMRGYACVPYGTPYVDINRGLGDDVLFEQNGYVAGSWVYEGTPDLAQGITDTCYAYNGEIQDISSAVVSFDASDGSYVYRGEPITPQVTVSDSAGSELELGVDYEIAYFDEAGNEVTPPLTSEGTYRVTVSGIGSYRGTKETSFAISPFETTWTSHSGDTPLATMKGIYDDVFSSSKMVVVAPLGDTNAALVATGLAGALDVSVVFTSAYSLSSEAKLEISRLGATSVVVIESSLRLQEATLNSLRSVYGVQSVNEIYRVDPCELSAKTYALGATPSIGAKWGTSCVVASSASLESAISALPWAYLSDATILLVGSDGKLSDDETALLKEGAFDDVLIVTSKNVDSSVESQVKNACADAVVTRIGSEDPYKTSQELVAWSQSRGMDGASLGIVTLTDDGVARSVAPLGVSAALACALSNAPLLVFAPSTSQYSTEAYLSSLKYQLETGYTFKSASGQPDDTPEEEDDPDDPVTPVTPVVPGTDPSNGGSAGGGTSSWTEDQVAALESFVNSNGTTSTGINSSVASSAKTTTSSSVAGSTIDTIGALSGLDDLDEDTFKDVDDVESQSSSARFFLLNRDGSLNITLLAMLLGNVLAAAAIVYAALRIRKGSDSLKSLANPEFWQTRSKGAADES